MGVREAIVHTIGVCGIRIHDQPAQGSGEIGAPHVGDRLGVGIR